MATRVGLWAGLGLHGAGAWFLLAQARAAPQVVQGPPSLPAAAPSAAASTIFALTGLTSVLTAFILQFAKWWREDRDKMRQDRDRDRQLERLAAENSELRRRVEQVPSNTVRIAGESGRVDAVIEGLQERGVLALPAGLEVHHRPAPPEQTAAPTRPRATLLVVEDDPDTARLLAKLFTRQGFIVSVAGTVAESSEMLLSGYHWIILDLRLSDGDGLDVLRLARDRTPWTQVAILTGSDDSRQLDAARALGPDALLIKPISFQDLIDRIVPTGQASPSGRQEIG